MRARVVEAELVVAESVARGDLVKVRLVAEAPRNAEGDDRRAMSLVYVLPLEEAQMFYAVGSWHTIDPTPSPDREGAARAT